MSGTEQPLYQNGATYISNARAIMAGTAFAISGISSVRTQVETKKNYWPAFLLFLAGFFIGIFSGVTIIVGIAALIGVVIFIATKPVTTYKIVTVTHGREFGMLTTTDPDEAAKISESLNAAIVAQAQHA